MNRAPSVQTATIQSVANFRAEREADWAAFEALLDRIETVELAGEPARSKSTFVGGLKTLPLRFTAA